MPQFEHPCGLLGVLCGQELLNRKGRKVTQIAGVFALKGKMAQSFRLRRTSHATVASIPHQPRKLTNAAIFVSYGNTPRLEKMVCQSCSMKWSRPL